MSVFRELRISPRIVDACDYDERLLPPGLSALNAAVGIAAAEAYLGRRAMGDSDVWRTVATIRLPGRLTTASDLSGREWVIDAAVNREAVEVAIEYALERVGNLDLVMVSLPAGKDVANTVQLLNARLGGEKWVPIRPPFSEHLTYSAEPWGKPLMSLCDAEARVQHARHVLAVGSWTFVSAVLARLNIDCEVAFVIR
jgi:folylpolyglutamate synthase/dihydropteroate synthase